MKISKTLHLRASAFYRCWSSNWLFPCLCSFLAFIGASAKADTPWTQAVEITASADDLIPKITLTWKADPNDNIYSSGYYPAYTVYRRSLAATSWTQLGTGDGQNHIFVDPSVTVGTPYEYKIVKQFNYATISYTGYGYIRAGIKVPAIESRGTVLVMVDNAIANGLPLEIARLQSDLLGDGWKAKVISDLGRNDTPEAVRSRIQSEHSADPTVTTVFLLGHFPVVYAGNSNPDGHQARKMPADAFYGDLDGTWGTPDSNGVYLPANTQLPSAVELAVGRVDFANMPDTLTLLSTTEVALLRGYLDKDHSFRYSTIRPTRRALMGDAFGDFAPSNEAFSVSGYRNFGGLVGISSGTLVTADATYGASSLDRWITKLAAANYLWAYGCGAGNDTPYSGINRLGTYTSEGTLVYYDMYSEVPKASFYMVFGSWVVDWAKNDNFMRATLGVAGYGLSSAWSGRPYLYFHSMGLGAPIGEGILLSQNNDGIFYHSPVTDYCHGFHIALMGDPTLRQDYVEPPSNPTATKAGANVDLAWTAPSDGTILGYYVYRSTDATGPFTQHLGNLVTGTSFVDSTPPANAPTIYYMVRALKLETIPSGTYYNLSEGAYCSTTNTSPDTPWFTDNPPAGSSTSTNGDPSAWTLVTSAPSPYHGSGSRQSAIASGLHEHSFNFASAGMSLTGSDVIYTYVYLDGANVPTELMLSFNDGSSWEHRAYWGDNSISYGTDGTASRFRIGNMPTSTNSWVRLEIPVADLGLGGATVVGMAFSQYGGQATWNEVGKGSATSGPQESLWFADNPPAGASTSTNGDPTAWTLVTTNPTPHEGTGSRQSSISSGFHEHGFNFAFTGMPLSTGDKIYVYVYIDGANMPDEIMLSFNDGSSWEHRAYWGNNTITYGTDGTASRHRVGGVPAQTDQWYRLEVNASDVGLEGSTVTGMGFSLYGGRVTWNAVGKISP